jgi:NAD(P)-dependent dehydrogenase (short-subunit alcohol dehydrogenase family)
MGSLDGRTAFVTGASRGIGAAVARRLASEGAAVAVVARSLDAHPHLPGSLRETTAAIEAAGGRAVAIAADLLVAEQRAAAVDRTRAELGPLDLLVNNAAASFYMPIEEVSEKRFRVAFEVNVRAPFDFAQRFLGDLGRNGDGVIVNISSASAAHPTRPYGPFWKHGGAVLYGATKAALDRLSTGFAAELEDEGIAVNSLSPVAAVMTPGVEALAIVPEGYAASAEPVECMAEAVLALCEPREPQISGRVLFSRILLAELARPARSLDGARVVEAPAPADGSTTCST